MKTDKEMSLMLLNQIQDNVTYIRDKVDSLDNKFVTKDLFEEHRRAQSVWHTALSTVIMAVASFLGVDKFINF
jgi:hypothetical protein